MCLAAWCVCPFLGANDVRQHVRVAYWITAYDAHMGVKVGSSCW